MSKLITTLTLIFGWIIYGLSYLFPKDKNIWVFHGWHTSPEREIFADNSKYLFLYVHHHHKDIRPIWICKDRMICKVLNQHGFEAHYMNSLKGIYLSLRAGATIADAFLSMANWQLSGGSLFIQLWHGKGPKKIGYNSPYGFQRYSKFLHPYLFQIPAFQIASSPFTAELVASSFGIPKEKVKVTGLPKYDVYTNPEPGSKIDQNTELEQKIIAAKKNNQRVFLYTPTFRPDGTSPLINISLEDLDKGLSQKDIKIIISLHPKFSVKNWMPDKEFRHIDFAPAGYDLYPILPMADGLITDYSSTYVDFLLLNKPIIFFPFDIDVYKEKMGIHEEFWDLMPGPHVKTSSELVKAIASYDDSLWKVKRREVTDKLHTFKDGGASKRIVKEITTRFNLERPSR